MPRSGIGELYERGPSRPCFLISIMAGCLCDHELMILLGEAEIGILYGR